MPGRATSRSSCTIMCASTLHYTEKKAPHTGSATNVVVFMRIVLKRLIERLNIAQLEDFLEHSNGARSLSCSAISQTTALNTASRNGLANPFAEARKTSQLTNVLLAGSASVSTSLVRVLSEVLIRAEHRFARAQVCTRTFWVEGPCLMFSSLGLCHLCVQG